MGKDEKIEIGNTDIINAISSEGFSSLSDSMQEKVLNSINASDDKDGGFMGKLFGRKKENAAMNIAFTICLLLVVIGIICMIAGNEQWNIVITGIMTTVGYIFGRGAKD